MSQYSTYLCYSTYMYMYHLPHAWPMASEPTAKHAVYLAAYLISLRGC